jgi:hypothetical protein
MERTPVLHDSDGPCSGHAEDGRTRKRTHARTHARRTSSSAGGVSAWRQCARRHSSPDTRPAAG